MTGRLRFNPQQRQEISPLASVSRPALWLTQHLVQWVLGVLSPGVQHGQGVTLTTHPHLVPRSWMSRSYTSSPPVPQQVCCGTAFIVKFSSVHTVLDHVSTVAGLTTAVTALPCPACITFTKQWQVDKERFSVYSTRINIYKVTLNLCIASFKCCMRQNCFCKIYLFHNDTFFQYTHINKE
jgi:hypothetical protein